MAVRDITRPGVESALEEFHRIGLGAMLEKYGGAAFVDLYVEIGNWVYSLELLVRAAHVHLGLGDLPPEDPGGFNVAEATDHLEGLGYHITGTLQSTNSHLASPRATEPLMRWLIGAAKQRVTLTYRDARNRLMHECGFTQIFPTRMGVPVGEMQYAIHRLDSTAPLLHVLLVRSSGTRAEIGKPGNGASVFLIRRFPDEDRLREPDVWAEYVGRATHEVYNYRGWEALYRQLYGDYVPDPYYATPPAEDDGVPRGGSDEVVREKSAEQPRAPTRPVALNPRHQAPVVVVENRQRDRAEERERVHVPVDPCLGRRRRVCPNVRCVAVRQVEGEEMDLLLDPADERPRFAEIGLRVPRRMNQRHVHLPTPTMMLANMVLHDRVPAGEPVLVAKTIEDALRGVPLLAMVVLAIPPQPLVDESGKSVELRTAERRTRSIFLTLSRETPKWRAAARSLIPSRHARRTLRYSSTV